MAIHTLNPATEQITQIFTELNEEEIKLRLEKSQKASKIWKETQLSERAEKMHKLALLLREKRDSFANLITLEMGMPTSQAPGEIEKSAQIAEYYADNAESFLAPVTIETGNKESYISYEPLGTILHIAPWNYPYYLAFRPIIPAIMAGNTVILKHASNVPQISLSIEAIFKDAGFPEGVFQSLLIGSSKVEQIIRDPRVKMVTLIGSEFAGMKVAKTAGEELKKTVMELGGSDPFVVLKDANLEEAAKQATTSRLRNQGQSCNAAKRFIVEEEIAEKFLTKVKDLFENEIVGDPTNPKTTIGPVANNSSLKDLKRQVEESVKLGAEVLLGGHDQFEVPSKQWNEFKIQNQKGFFYPPTILRNVNKQMPVYKEEVFGPVVPIIIVQSIEEAIQVANDSSLGLGASLWTENLKLAKNLIPKFESGMVCVNSMVRSNIKLPYGGVKRSGYGRELGKDGIKEFVNVKSVLIK